MSNPFAGMVKSQVYGGGNYLSPDFEGLLKIEEVIWNAELQTDGGGQALIVEFTVLESNETKDANGKVLDPVGVKRSWFQKKNKSFESAALEFLYGVLKVDHKNDTELADKVKAKSADLMWEACQKPIFKGKLVRCRTIAKPKKENKNEKFTKHIWSPAT